MSEVRRTAPQIDEHLLNEIVQDVFGWTLEEMYSGPYSRELTKILAEILKSDGYSAQPLAAYHPVLINGLKGRHHLARASARGRLWLLDPSWRTVAKAMGVDRRGLPGLVVVEKIDNGNAPDTIGWLGDHDLEWPLQLKSFMLETYEGAFGSGADDLKRFENEALSIDVAKSYIGAVAVAST